MADLNEKGAPARDWERVFNRADVLTEELRNAKSSRAKSTRIGNVLAPNVGREIPIEVKGQSLVAVLRLELGRANERRYYFEIGGQEIVGPTVQAELTPIPELPTGGKPAPAESHSTDSLTRQSKKPQCVRATKRKKEAVEPSVPASSTSQKPVSGNSEDWE